MLLQEGHLIEIGPALQKAIEDNGIVSVNETLCLQLIEGRPSCTRTYVVSYVLQGDVCVVGLNPAPNEESDCFLGTNREAAGTWKNPLASFGAMVTDVLQSAPNFLYAR